MKKMYNLLVVALLALSTVAFSQPVSVTNGGFEDGIDDGSWAMEANEGASAEFISYSDDVQEGSKALQVFVDVLGANDWSQQIFNRTWDVETGKSYRLGLWFKSTCTGEDTMKVSLTCGHGINYTEYGRLHYVPLEKEWQELVLYFTSPITSDGVDDIISMSTHFVGLGSCLVDNFTVTETQNMGGEISEAGEVIVNFVEPIADPAGNEGSFEVTVDGVANVVTGIATDATDLNKVILTMTDAVAAGSEVVVNYTPGTLATSSGTDINEFSITIGGSGVGVNEKKAEMVAIYPNPATDVVYFDVQNVASVELFDITGKRVESVKSDVSSVNLSDLNSGIYFVIINDTEGKVYTNRIIKE